MEIGLKQLMEVCLPPSTPVDNGSSEFWKQVEDKTNLSLPLDYKQYINLYGLGCWANFIWVLNPFSPKQFNLINENECILQEDREFREQFPDNFFFPIFPEKDGIYLWGVTNNGDRLYWQTTGTPSNWPIIVFDAGNTEFEIFPITMTVFLSYWLTRKIQCKIFPTYDKYFDPAFKPIEVLEQVNIYINYNELPYEDSLKKLMRLFQTNKVESKFEQLGNEQCKFTDDLLRATIVYRNNNKYGSILTISYDIKVEEQLKRLIDQIKTDLGWLIWQIIRSDGSPVWPMLINSSPPE